MKMFALRCAALLPCLLLLLSTNGHCKMRIDCQWGPFGTWSECDGCTKSQTRSRAIAVYSQFNGNPCDGERTETRACQTTKGCPLDQGCGERFTCFSGQCISQSLLCNGDQDCEEDGYDERGCESGRDIVCEHSLLPPNIELLGDGVDVLSGKTRGSVINTKSFGGQCRTIRSGTTNSLYRLPLSTTQFNFVVKVQREFSDEMFTSQWSYAKDVVQQEKVSGTTTGFRNYDFHETLKKTQSHKLMILKNDIEVAQFRSNSPQFLQLSDAFWKDLSKLPTVYDYSAYRKVIERFGTHYMSEGSLGGNVRAFVGLDMSEEIHIVRENLEHNECERTKRWILFFPLYIVNCKKNSNQQMSNRGFSREIAFTKVNVLGGGLSHIAALETMQHNEPEKNQEMYSNWADSVTSFPQIIKQKLRPLTELVKEVQCAGVKKLYLQRAIDQYLTESDSCHCQPCDNNGLAILDGDQCTCVCKPGTSGIACETGIPLEGQRGVIDGRWSCWSTWSDCVSGLRSRRRSCSNPSPQYGGQHCIGEPTEMSECEEQDLQHLKLMEPQCFNLNLPAVQKCRSPPALINGYMLNPKDFYIVGNKVEYTCTAGFYLLGNSLLECTSNLTWSAKPGLCKISMCKLNLVAKGVSATPLKAFYAIGDSVTLSCPEGQQLKGEAIVKCDASLQFSPDPTGSTCQAQALAPQTPLLVCKSWQKALRGQCVCKSPFECSSSLELCASSPTSSRSLPLTVCKMHALMCMGKNYIIAEDSTCKWPPRNTAGCSGCHMWEMCDGQTNTCACKDSVDCSSQGVDVCVRLGEDEALPSQTMNECEAGLRRCKGEKVTVISIHPCPS